MSQQILIDTDILIDFGLDKPDALQTLEALELDFSLSVSVITAMELYSGCRSKIDLKHVDNLLSRYNIHYISNAISKKAFEWMKQYRSSHGVVISGHPFRYGKSKSDWKRSVVQLFRSD